MLYRIRTNQTTDWMAAFDKSLLDTLHEYGKSADELPWEPAGRIVDHDMLRVALRYGYRSAVGLVVDAVDLVPLDHRNRIIEAHAEWLWHRPEYRKAIEQLDSTIMPGELAVSDELDARVVESVRASIQEAHDDYLLSLEKELHHALVAHWQGLGGALPEPL